MEGVIAWLFENANGPVLALAGALAWLWWKLRGHEAGCDTRHAETLAEMRRIEARLMDRIDSMDLETKGRLSEGSALFRRIEGALQRLDERTK